MYAQIYLMLLRKDSKRLKSCEDQVPASALFVYMIPGQMKNSEQGCSQRSRTEVVKITTVFSPLHVKVAVFLIIKKKQHKK